MKSDLNVFTYGFMPLTYWKNWFRNIKQFFRNLKYAWQRATKGYCDWDTWDLSSYYTELIRDTLNCMADNLYGWPSQKFETEDDWKQYLRDIATKLDNSIDREFDDYQVYINPYEEEYSKMLLEKPTFETKPDGTTVWHSNIDDKFWKKYSREEQRIFKLRDKDMKTALKMLSEVWWHLWD